MDKRAGQLFEVMLHDKHLLRCLLFSFISIEVIIEEGVRLYAPGRIYICYLRILLFLSLIRILSLCTT